MKSTLLIVFASIITIMRSILHVPSNDYSHKKLIDWLNKNSIQSSEKGKNIISDEDIINVLSEYSENNKQYLKYIDSFPDLSQEICPDSAQLFHYYYNQRKRDFLSVNHPTINSYRLDLDNSQAILLKLNDVLYLADEAFNLNNKIDFNSLQEKGLLIYFSNYGPNGRLKGTQLVDNYVSSAILQFAQDTTLQTPNEWQVIPNKIYNYGDIKPPKTYSNEQIIDSYPRVFTCPPE